MHSMLKISTNPNSGADTGPNSTYPYKFEIDGNDVGNAISKVVLLDFSWTLTTP